MDSSNNGGVTPEQAAVQEMLNTLKGQRDQAADSMVSLMGEVAAWRARWNNLQLVQARYEELAEAALDKVSE